MDEPALTARGALPQAVRSARQRRGAVRAEAVLAVVVGEVEAPWLRRHGCSPDVLALARPGPVILYGYAAHGRERRARVRRRAMIRLLAVYVVLAVLELAAPGAVSAADEGYVAVGRLQGVVNPASASYVERAIDAAEAGGATLFVLELDTPGGLDSSMRRIVQRVLASATPVVVYVAPPGAR